MKRNLFNLFQMARPALGLSLILAGLSVMAMADPGVPPPAPEIDAGSIGSALTLLTSGAFLFAGKSRKA